MDFVVPIGGAGLSLKAKYFLKQSRGFNFDPIGTKLGTDVDLPCR